ncbi:MAG: hypothetical protein ABSG86_31015 [Thermoguttaceae bacterium]|jgi:hypothetical protein
MRDEEATLAKARGGPAAGGSDGSDGRAGWAGEAGRELLSGRIRLT